MKDSKSRQPFLKKHWSNILFFGVVLLFIIPGSRMIIQSQLASLFSSAPTILEDSKREQLANYNLVLKDLQGQSLNLNQSQNKPILINFWATWCAPCLAELPELNALYQKYKDEVDFYFISQETPDILKTFLSAKAYNLPVYTQVSKAPSPLNTNTLPSTYLINSHGKIVALAQKSAKWNNEEIQILIEGMSFFRKY